jgi:signal peptidase I
VTVVARSTEVGPTRPGIRDGWAWLIFSLVARAYLVLLIGLAVIAIAPSIAGWNSSVVQTGSMEPKINPGDVVLTSSLPRGSAAPLGRVVAFHSPAEAEPSGTSTIRLHRIVSANADGTFVTAGDANADVDSTPLDRTQIIGQGRLLIRFVGLPSLWIQTGDITLLSAWALLTAGALLLVVLDHPPAADNGPPSRTPAVRTRAVRADRSGRARRTGLLPRPRVARRALLAAVAGVALIGLAAVPTQPSLSAFTTNTSTGHNSWTVATYAPLTLGRASSYLLLANTSIIKSDTLGAGTAINGNVATSPGTAVTGFWPWDITGSIDLNNAVARNAKTDTVALYASANARTTTATRSPTLTGTLAPGIYASTSSAFTTTGTLTLDAHGDPSAVFVFRATTITTATSAVIKLVNGADADNVFWRSGTTITLGTSSVNQGNFLSSGNATMQNSSKLTGRLISLNGSITVTHPSVTTP